MSKGFPGVKVFNFTVGTARDYWVQIAAHDAYDFEQSPSARTAAHVAQSLWAVLEWHADEQGTAVEACLKQLAPACPELRWIKDIAFSAKHRTLTRKKPAVAHAGFLLTGASAFGSVTGYGSTAGGYGTIEFVIGLDDGTSRPLLNVIQAVNLFWKSILDPELPR